MQRWCSKLRWLRVAWKFLHGSFSISQRVHVGRWYILRAQRSSHIPTLRPKYIPYTYMDPLGIVVLGSLGIYRDCKVLTESFSESGPQGPQRYVGIM